MYFNQTMGVWVGFFLFSLQLYFLNTLVNVFCDVAMAKWTSHLFPWPALYLYCCDSLWQGAAAIPTSISGYIMNENHEINVFPCHFRQKFLLNFEMTHHRTQFFFFNSELCCALKTTVYFTSLDWCVIRENNVKNSGSHPSTLESSPRFLLD